MLNDILGVLIIGAIVWLVLVCLYLLWHGRHNKSILSHHIKNKRTGKRYGVFFAVPFAIIATSCATVTPTPIAVTATPVIDPTPTQETIFYTDCFTGERVENFQHVNTNGNPCLRGDFQEVGLGTEDGRYVALFDGYWFWQVPTAQNTYAYMNAGAYFFRDAPRNGMQLELVQVDGQFGVQFEQVFERGICYIIKQTGTNSFPNGSMDNVSLAGQIHLTDGAIVYLRNQAFPARFSGTNGYEMFWVVETQETYIEGVVAIYTELVWGSYLQGTHVTIHAIEVLESPQGFCEGDGVITLP